MPVRPLSPELAELARVELEETPKRLEDGIVHLRDWISKQPHLKARTDDQWLATFIRGCKYSLEKAKEKIDLYYALRSTAPDLYSLKYSDPKFLEILDLGITLVLPKTAGPTGPRVMIARPGLCDPNKYGINSSGSVTYFMQQVMQIEDDNLILSGGIYVMDLKGITMSHITQATPVHVKKMIASGQIHIHKDLESLYKHVPKDILPVEYGGTGGTIAEIVDDWKRKYKEYSSWLEEDLQYTTDETKRPGKPKTAEEMFGVEGSFRQLEFD